MKKQLLTEEPGRGPDFEATAQKLWSSFAADAGHRPLAPEALSREAIYDDVSAKALAVSSTSISPPTGGPVLRQ